VNQRRVTPSFISKTDVCSGKPRVRRMLRPSVAS
jgi:hypothetical protein